MPSLGFLCIIASEKSVGQICWEGKKEREKEREREKKKERKNFLLDKQNVCVGTQT